MLTNAEDGKVKPACVTAESPQGGLKKELGAGEFFTLSFAAIVGIGWIVVLGDWLRGGGPLGAIIAFLMAGAVMMLVGLCYAEIATTIPASGGEIAYAYEVFGLRTSFVSGWFLALVWISATSFEAISTGWIAGIIFPALRGTLVYSVRGAPVMSGSLTISLTGTAFLTALNYRGMKGSGRFQDVFTWTKIVISVLLVTVGIIWGSTRNLHPFFAKPAGDTDRWTGMLSVLVTAPFWLAGFNAVAQVMPEKEQQTSYRRVAFALLASIAAASIFYALLILSCSMAMPWIQLTRLEFPAVGAFEAALHSILLAKMVLLSALLGLLATWNSVFVASSRVLYALGRARMIHPRFGTVHYQFGAPTFSILFVGVLSAAGILLGRSALLPIVSMDSSCFMLMYVIVCVSVIKLRKTDPTRPRPYSVPGGSATAVTATLASAYMLVESFYLPYASNARHIPLEWMLFLGWAVVGVLFWAISNSGRDSISESQRRLLVLGDGTIRRCPANDIP